MYVCPGNIHSSVPMKTKEHKNNTSRVVAKPFTGPMVDIKTTSNAVWWIKNPKQPKGSESWGTTLCQDMTDLFRHISLHGYNKLLDTGLFSYEKFIWLCLHVTIFIFMSIALTFTWDKFVLQHFVINLHDPLYPVEDVPFPSVSICSNNRISRIAAEKYAHELSKMDPANRTADYFTSRILYFNSFYYKFARTDNFTEFSEFQKFLDHYGTGDNETFYNVSKVMEWLTPSCENFIVGCSLGAKKIDCFDENAFQRSLTVYGPCCTFNANDGYRKRTHPTRYAGSNMGLLIILNTSHIDDTVSLLNIDGYAVMIHSSTKYPDSASGIYEVFPTANKETFLGVNARLMDSEEGLRTFTPSHRNCYFDNEAPNQNLLINGRYSWENCINRCRARSVIALCRCVPFYTFLPLLENIEAVPFCTLSHIECMQKYTFKWRNVLTERVNIKGLEREVEEGLYCFECLPSCDHIQYEVSMMSLPIDRYSLPDGVDNTQLGLNFSDISVLHVFFDEYTVPFYRRVITNSWFNALSTVGNIVSICMGFSLIALMEILYFILKHLVIALKNYMRESPNHSTRKKDSHLELKHDKLYICP